MPKRKEMWSGVHSYIVWTGFYNYFKAPASTEMSLENRLLLDWSEDHENIQPPWPKKAFPQGDSEWGDGNE